MELLITYRWPGNIRELEHAIEQAVALLYQPVLTPEDLPREVREQRADQFSSNQAAPSNSIFPISQVLKR